MFAGKLISNKLKLTTLTRSRSITSFWCHSYCLWADFTHCPGVSTAEFEQVNAGWDMIIDMVNMVESWKELPKVLNLSALAPF